MISTASLGEVRPTTIGWFNGVLPSLGFACVVLITDLAGHRLNLSILYTIVIYVLALRLKGRWTLVAALALVVATYAGLFFGVHPPGLESAASLIQNYRFTNRSFSAVAILATAFIAGWHYRWLRRLHEQLSLDDSIVDHSIYLDLVAQVQLLKTLLIAIVISALLVGIDCTTASEINFPILYAVPLLLCVLSGSVQAIWVMTPVLIVLTWVGYWASSDMSQPAAVYFALNRVLSSVMLLTLAVAGTYFPPQGKH